MSEVEGERIGILSMTYDHSQRGLVTTLLDIEHEFSGITRSATQSKSYRRALKGIKNVKLTTIRPGQEM
jgi:CopG family nickel-responsive transcriptional regulator